MNKIKEYVAITVIALCFMLITGIAKADATPKQFVETVVSVPGKLGNHIQMEIAKTKEFQAKNWIKMKSDFAKLKKKFIKD
jgi:hypothetical protein